MKENPCTNLEDPHNSIDPSNPNQILANKDLSYLTNLDHQDQRVVGGLFIYEHMYL
jgi:hypothetical protein